MIDIRPNISANTVTLTSDWFPVPTEPTSHHDVFFSVLATDGQAAHLGDIHMFPDQPPFMTDQRGIGIHDFTPTWYTHHYIPSVI